MEDKVGVGVGVIWNRGGLVFVGIGVGVGRLEELDELGDDVKVEVGKGEGEVVVGDGITSRIMRSM